MGKIYALSDIHGFYSIYEQVKEFLKPDDHVYFLGDAADRGPQGWECIKAILDDPQFTYIMGNHDLMFVRSIIGPDKLENHQLHDYNGGAYTYMSYQEDEIPQEEKKEYILKLSKAVPYVIYYTLTGGIIYLSHSGKFAKEIDDLESFVWDRAHFYTDADPSVELIVHGHTSIRSLIHSLNEHSLIYEEDMIDGSKEFIPGQPFFYANWTKCDIDCSTIVSGSATLLNLDTLEGIPFFVKGWEKDFLWRG